MDIDTDLEAAIAQTYDDLRVAGTEVDWTVFSARLPEFARTNGVSAETAAAFVQELENSDPNPMATIAAMCAESEPAAGPDSGAAAQSNVAATPQPQAEPEPLDEGAWNAF